MKDAHVMGGVKAIGYGIIWLALFVTLVRGVVGPLWGSASDYGLVGALLCGVGGLLALARLALAMKNDVLKSFEKEKTNEDS